MSSKERVVIDEVDYEKLLRGMHSGSFVQLKNAVINPSFISHITPVSEKQALEVEAPQGTLKGHVDLERGVYVVTEEVAPEDVMVLTDKFPKREGVVKKIGDMLGGQVS